MMRNFFNSKISFIALFLLSFAWLTLWFDCDPSILRRSGDFADEGYWYQNAANKINHGKFLTDDQGQAFFGAPIYNALLTTFMQMGLERIFMAKLLSILFTFGAGVLLFRILSTFVQDRKQVFLFTALFFLLAEVKYYSAWISPVSMEMLGLMFYLTFILKNQLISTAKIAIAGFLVLVCIGIKLTSIILIPALALHILFDLAANNLISWRSFKHGFAKLFVGVSIPICGYVLINLMLKSQYPHEFKQFGQVVAWNLNLKLGLQSIIYESLNIAFYIKGFTGILKYPSAALLVVIPFFMLINFAVRFNRKQWSSMLFENRPIKLIFLLLLVSYGYFTITGTMGFDRRLVIYLPVYVLLSGLLWSSFTTLLSQNTLQRLLSAMLLLLILAIQFWALRDSGLLKVAAVRNSMAMLAAFSMAVLLIRRNWVPSFLILGNVTLVLLFPPQGYNLTNARKQVDELTRKHHAAYTTGQDAHLLSMESGAIPVWYLKNMFNWNHKLDLFGSGRPVALIEAVNHPNPAYLNRTDMPQTKIIDSAEFNGFNYAGKEGITHNHYKLYILTSGK